MLGVVILIIIGVVVLIGVLGDRTIDIDEVVSDGGEGGGGESDSDGGGSGGGGESDSDGAECVIDSDCVKVQTTCCSCSSGGEESCVPNNEVESYQQELESCPSNLICIALYNCQIESCQCIEGKCS